MKKILVLRLSVVVIALAANGHVMAEGDMTGQKPIEIKGPVWEIEVYPKGTAEWWFVPVKTGKLNDLKCVIKGHAEAGMVGTITIK